jgi:hypothetical protein
MENLLNSPKNWTSDFEHENGKYLCSCIFCRRKFLGHKRRNVCKECDAVEPKVNLEINGQKVWYYVNEQHRL